MASILRVKDKKGRIINIPVLQGPKGDPSPPPQIVATKEQMTDVKKQYVLLETGTIFACVKGAMKECTDTISLQDGYRLGSSGAATEDTGYVLTDYIDTKGYPGTFRICLKGAEFIPDEQTGSVRWSAYSDAEGMPNVLTQALFKSAVVAMGFKEVSVEGDTVVLTITPDMLPMKTNTGAKYRYLRFGGLKIEGETPEVIIDYMAVSDDWEWVDTGIKYAPELTEEIKQEIAEKVFNMVDNQLLEIIGSGEMLV